MLLIHTLKAKVHYYNTYPTIAVLHNLMGYFDKYEYLFRVIR